jgi:hypothetical protein
MTGRRATYVLLAVGTIAVGLLVHRSGIGLPPAPRDILGDVLWAMMIYWWIAVLAPALATRFRAAVALGICFAVEASQLLHTPALDAVRNNSIGHLFLGSGFDPRDFAAYSAGVVAAVILERLLVPFRPRA